ncbi:hypothetical protein LG634_18135 [Streptomyces bambusae]|uniref:hypothetical protein n=1 Tax=Streptomyces bambusae TaxID=1550616 RepID=UPI001CFD27E0|nr:hypothetical protein [Streptomyces bambusae]MCB5166752.1 hypothetical protein [Streptomyces bambusae]
MAAVLLTACSAGGGPRAVPGPPPLEPLASAVPCTPEVVTDAGELREGACRTGEGAYRLLTFATPAGEQAWLTEARAYGGSYLVGDRWVLVAQHPGALDAVRARLGGTVEGGAHHGSAHHGSAPP